MTGPHDNGVGGILEQLLTPVSKGRAHRQTPQVSGRGGDSPPKLPIGGSALERQTGARRGRPPGNLKTTKEPKQKLTVRINRDLIAQYRDWSWEARCQLSELVERALANYQQSRRR